MDDHPSEVVSITELRAHHHNDPSLWSPLDALRHCVREMEAGNYNADMVYVAFSQKQGKLTEFRYVVAGPRSRMETMGLLQQHLHDRSID